MSSSCSKYDVIIIGGGIIGSAIAKVIKESSVHTKIALLEKENDLAKHQSSHNSNVIHAGIYYKPNSLKAKLCVKGTKLIYDYCESKNIPYNKCGKLIISQNSLDNFRLKELYKRGVQNQVEGLELLEKWDHIQPNTKGVKALWSPVSGNIDWEIVTKQFANDFEKEGGHLVFNYEVGNVEESTEPDFPLLVTSKKSKNRLLGKFAVLCMGLQSGTIFETVCDNTYKNICLKAHYSLLNPLLCRFIKTNIYDMPHLDMPFIGVHFSPINGKVLLGPSTIPALSQVDYTRDAPKIDVGYFQKNVFSKNLGLLFAKNIHTCLNQVSETVLDYARTVSLCKLFPMVSKSDILPGPVGVQAQIVTSDGEFYDDFIIEILEGKGIRKRIVNCRFLPSPGATASLALAEMITSVLSKKLRNL